MDTAVGYARERRLRHGRADVGWLGPGTLKRRYRRLEWQPSFTRMKVGNIARWINRNSGEFWNSMYDPRERYEIVVFSKVMDRACQDEAARIQGYGGKVIFDANVNYYEIWGDYDIPGTRPTAEQQRDATALTTAADWVVADSSYLLDVIKSLNPRVTWIPDNVDVRVYQGVREHRSRPTTRLVWSGVAKKAQHLTAIVDVLHTLRGVELVLVTDGVPGVLRELRSAIPCRLVWFSERVYARTLRNCDIIISPKRLINGYEMAHTEYKIALGMAVGLPAVASPQQSYVEAISHRGGGIIADGEGEWRDALQRLVHEARLRGELGMNARQTVLERYATPVVARQYLDLFSSLR